MPGHGSGCVCVDTPTPSLPPCARGIWGVIKGEGGGDRLSPCPLNFVSVLHGGRATVFSLDFVPE